MNRRQILTYGISTLALSRLQSVHGQALHPIRLLVVRYPATGPQDSCRTPCIRGSIFDLTDTLAADSKKETLFSSDPEAIAFWSSLVLTSFDRICDTIERPWKDNAPNISSIPPGVYGANIRNDPTKKWMKKDLDLAWRLELTGTAKRTNIQFHYGKDEKWSAGCFIVGDHISEDGDDPDKFCKLKNSKSNILKLKDIVQREGRTSDGIKIMVVNNAGVFPFIPPACA